MESLGRILDAAELFRSGTFDSTPLEKDPPTKFTVIVCPDA